MKLLISPTFLINIDNIVLFCLTGVMSFLWLVCFCYLTDFWRRTNNFFNSPGAQAALAFAFFSLLIFVSSDRSMLFSGIYFI